MTTYFVLVDTQRRHFPNAFKSSVIGPFLISGCAATYPFDHLVSNTWPNWYFQLGGFFVGQKEKKNDSLVRQKTRRKQTNSVLKNLIVIVFIKQNC